MPARKRALTPVRSELARTELLTRVAQARVYIRRPIAPGANSLTVFYDPAPASKQPDFVAAWDLEQALAAAAADRDPARAAPSSARAAAGRAAAAPSSARSRSVPSSARAPAAPSSAPPARARARAQAAPSSPALVVLDSSEGEGEDAGVGLRAGGDAGAGSDSDSSSSSGQFGGGGSPLSEHPSLASAEEELAQCLEEPISAEQQERCARQANALVAFLAARQAYSADGAQKRCPLCVGTPEALQPVKDIQIHLVRVHNIGYACGEEGCSRIFPYPSMLAEHRHA